MIRTTIHAGICGFTTTVLASSEDSQTVTLKIETNCDKIRKLTNGLTSVDAYDELGAGADGTILKLARVDAPRGICAGCVVPNGIFKAMQAAASLALPADVSLKIERVD